MRSIGLAGLLVMGWAMSAEAALHEQLIEYTHGDAVLEGYLAYDASREGRRPGVLIVHEWKGLNAYAKRRARELAQLGYIAFAIDMYGKGVRAKDHQEAAQLSGLYRSDRQLMRARATAGLDVLVKQPQVDPDRVAAIGYCFGGTTVLELARAGTVLKGVVSFHGGLSTPNPAAANQVTAQVLVLHGANDTFVSQEEVKAFEEEMRAAGASYRLIQYPGAVHSFTVPEAGSDPSQGMAYHAEADRQSWEALQTFLAEVFNSG